ncbi:MAG: MarR family transcriptional regulator [Gemmatimonadota bacterium]|nr:MarR family transcriptional regulator [Gemmatimonadota bacterium]
MSTPPLPAGLRRTRRLHVANLLHSMCIHVLRQARVADADTGLSPQRLSMLSVLTFAGSHTIGELATIEGVSRPAVSTLVSGLEADGLVRRERLVDDARSVLVHVTSSGRKLMAKGRQGRLQIVSKRLAGLSGSQLDVVEEALKLLE